MMKNEAGKGGHGDLECHLEFGQGRSFSEALC